MLMVAGDQDTATAFSVLDTVCAEAVLMRVNSPTATMLTQQHMNACRAISNVATHAQARSVSCIWQTYTVLRLVCYMTDKLFCDSDMKSWVDLLVLSLAARNLITASTDVRNAVT